MLKLFAGLVSAAAVLSAAFTVGKIRWNPETAGAGCGYALKGELAEIHGLVARDEGDDTLRLVIDGVKTALPFVTRRVVNLIRDKENLGDSLIEYYRGDGFEARLNLVTSRICGEAEECEALEYRGTLTLSGGGRTKTLHIDAECGVK